MEKQQLVEQVLKRPILIGGLGLAVSLSLLGGMSDLFTDGNTWATLIALGTGVWWWRRRQPEKKMAPPKPVIQVDREAVLAALAALQRPLDTLREELIAIADPQADSLLAEFAARRDRLQAELDRTTLQVAIAGVPDTGKTSLLTLLTASALGRPMDTLRLQEVTLAADTPHQTVLTEILQTQDAVLYMVTEDLTESAFNDIKTLAEQGQRVFLVLNKQDIYLPPDLALVVEQIALRLQSLPQTVSSGAIATAPKPIKVRSYNADGTSVERLETPEPDITPVLTTLETWLSEEVPQLVTQTVMRQTTHLRRDLQQALNRVRRSQAQPIIEHLQWAAAATAFASPLPSLDMLAAIAINGQLVMDLGRIYQQPLNLEQAQTIATELGSVVLKLGVVEVASHWITTALKSHAATYIVGGGVQAFSAAYLTQVCGESLVAYFEDRALAEQTEAVWSVEAIGQRLQTLLPSTQRSEFFQALVKRGVQKLAVFKPDPIALPASPAIALELSSAPHHESFDREALISPSPSETVTSTP